MHLSVLTTLCAFIIVTSAQDSPLTTPTLLPFYIPFPLASSGDYITSYTNDKFWKHEYRNYHVSVISARGDYVYYVIDCRPNLDHPSCTEPWACPQSVVCAEEIVEAGRMTATQKGLGRLDFSFRWDECSKTTVGQSSQTCARYEYRCSSSTAVDQTTRPCAKYENMRWTWDEVQDGTSYLEMSSLGHLSSAAKMLVTIGYGGADKVPAISRHSLWVTRCLDVILANR